MVAMFVGVPFVCACVSVRVYVYINVLDELQSALKRCPFGNTFLNKEPGGAGFQEKEQVWGRYINHNSEKRIESLISNRDLKQSSVNIWKVHQS